MLKGKIGLIVLILIVSVTVYRFYSRSNRIDEDGKVTMGVVVNEVVYTKNSHLSSPENRIHKYVFEVQGKTYKGNSQDSKYKVGDSILVRYVTSDPSQNNPDEMYK